MSSELPGAESGLGVRGAHVVYGSTTAVAGVDLHVSAGEVVAVLGPSGCGKSSLLRAVAGLEPLTSGAVQWDGVDLAGVPVHRRGFGLMFQDGQLFPHRDVAGNVEFGLRMAGIGRDRRAARVAELLQLVGLGEFGDRAVASLSGGEQQRVALARALAPRPALLLLDEPLSALDRELRESLATELRRILTETSTTALYVTHDHDEAFAVADRVAVMREGRLVQIGTPAQLWADPANAAVAQFLGFVVVEHEGKQVALGPDALVIEAGAGEPGAGGHSGPSGSVVATGFSRGRSTARVQVPGWGEVTAVAPSTHSPEPGAEVRLRIDWSYAVVL